MQEKIDSEVLQQDGLVIVPPQSYCKFVISLKCVWFANW